MERLRRKIDTVLVNWKNTPNHMPLIIKGARQIGKTEAVRHFAFGHYKSVVEINFVLQKQYRDIFDDGFEVGTILKNISLRNPDFEFLPGETLIFFDELQDCINCATSLKSFRLDGRYDVICSGSLMGINYNEIESNSVGSKEDMEMYSLDFEEFLWAKGYKESQIESLYQSMLSLTPLTKTEYDVMLENFREYMVLGGMPAIVFAFIQQEHYSGTLKMQEQILLDYEEDITKYASGLDKGKILSVYRKIPAFLGKDNKKFQISKIARNARNRDYIGTVEIQGFLWQCLMKRYRKIFATTRTSTPIRVQSMKMWLRICWSSRVIPCTSTGMKRVLWKWISLSGTQILLFLWR